MIGWMGGTYDPVHVGHLRVALDACEALKLTRLHLGPCAEPPHRGAPVTLGAQRLHMLELAVAGEACLMADDRELRRGGRSYSYDTLLSLRKEYGPSEPLCMLVGADAYAGLPSWHRWRELLDLAHIVVLSRPGTVLPEDGPLAGLWTVHGCHEPAALSERPHGSVLALDVSALEISSSDVRARLHAGRSARFLLTDSVLDYIRREQLYGSMGASC